MRLRFIIFIIIDTLRKCSRVSEYIFDMQNFWETQKLAQKEWGRCEQIFFWVSNYKENVFILYK